MNPPELLHFVAVIPRLRFKPNHAGLESILGELERPIMEVVWARGEASVSDVAASLNTDSAYTTVKTVMERLEQKGFLHRIKQGRAYVYTAAMSRETLEDRASRGVIEGLLSAFGSKAINQFAEVVREDPEKLAELRALLDTMPDSVPATRKRKTQ